MSKCTFCNNSGNKLSTDFDKESKDNSNFELLIYGNSYLRINSTAPDKYPYIRHFIELRPESVKINFCPMCGKNCN